MLVALFRWIHLASGHRCVLGLVIDIIDLFRIEMLLKALIFFSNLLVVVDQFKPVYRFIPTPKFLQNNHSYYSKLPMYMIKLIIICDVVNIFSLKNYESLRNLRVVVNWSTTTNMFYEQKMCDLNQTLYFHST